jgi:hypothetical protein
MQCAFTFILPGTVQGVASFGKHHMRKEAHWMAFLQRNHIFGVPTGICCMGCTTCCHRPSNAPFPTSLRLCPPKQFKPAPRIASNAHDAAAPCVNRAPLSSYTSCTHCLRGHMQWHCLLRQLTGIIFSAYFFWLGLPLRFKICRSARRQCQIHLRWVEQCHCPLDNGPPSHNPCHLLVKAHSRQEKACPSA